MEDTTPSPDETRGSHSSGSAYDALSTLITAAGFDAGDLQVALAAIQEAKTAKKTHQLKVRISFSLIRRLYMRM